MVFIRIVLSTNKGRGGQRKTSRWFRDLCYVKEVSQLSYNLLTSEGSITHKTSHLILSLITLAHVGMH